MSELFVVQFQNVPSEKLHALMLKLNETHEPYQVIPIKEVVLK